MKFIFAILLASFLLIAGCTGSAQQGASGNQAQQPVDEAPPAPPSDTQQAPPAPPAEPQQPPVTPAPSSNATTPSAISASELSLHNTEGDCWVAYKGKVYDVTSFIPQHPGGSSSIVKGCGTAEGFESAFTNKHGTSKVGVLMQNAPYMGDYAG